MKSITGALLILASSFYAIGAAIVGNSTRIGDDVATLCCFPAFVIFILGLYFLFFAKDKPSS